MLGNRLKTLLDALDVNQTTFSKEVGMSRTALNEVIRGRIKSLPPEILDFLISKYHVNLNWLLTGHGEMFLKTAEEERMEFESTPEERPVSRSSKHLDAGVAELLANPKTRRVIELFMEQPDAAPILTAYLAGAATIKELLEAIETLPENKRRVALLQIRALEGC